LEHSDYGALLLDTHIFLWLLAGDERLQSTGFVTGIEAASEEGQLRLSVMSIWEITALERNGRVGLAGPLDDFLKRAVETPGLAVVPLEADIAAEAARLPGELDGDFADRVLAATARLRAFTLVSADPRFASYRDQGHIRMLEAGA
jgi:PIN domain nuclease of toxin-antitoxin system